MTRPVHSSFIAVAGLIAWFVLVMAQASAQPQSDLTQSRDSLVVQMRQNAVPLDDQGVTKLLDSIGEARIVLLGESTHGSAEFYRHRAWITQRLIAERGFSGVLLEAGWGPTLVANSFVQGENASAAKALRAFNDFPRWTWRNSEFAKFLDELKRPRRSQRPGTPPVGVYGIDVYEAPAAIRHVLAFVKQTQPSETRATRQDYRCFSPYLTQGLDPSLYGRDVVRGWMPSCATRVARRHAHLSAGHTSNPTSQSFSAMMSARAVAGAEAYYRTLYTEGGVASWNQRERFMADSIDVLLARHGKVVVWAHNTHQGDARGTAQNQTGELSLGQLMRERHGDAGVFLLGLTTYAGQVRAASAWAAGATVKTLQPALEDSWPNLLHRVDLPAFILNWRHNPDLAAALDQTRRDRAVGVLYLPDDELNSHYFETRLGRQYDAVLHIDRTHALDYLH